MQKTLTFTFLLISLLITACGANETPLPTVEVASPTPTLIQPTQTSLPTETAIPVATNTAEPTATEAVVVQNPAGSNISFANQVLPIFQAYCIECHGGQRTREGLDMTTYNALIAGSNNGTVLIPGNANDSLFIELIEQGEMPSRGAAPSSAELQILIDWVNQGALNN
jgi:mono/diheme cytochrome c family protein